MHSLVIFIPPAKQSFKRVYSFQLVHHSVNISWILLNNFHSFCLFSFIKFAPHRHHSTTHAWKEKWVCRVSIARVMPLCNLSLRCLSRLFWQTTSVGNFRTLTVTDHNFCQFRSNCVVNLSPDKKAVLTEAHKVLKVSKLYYHMTSLLGVI